MSSCNNQWVIFRSFCHFISKMRTFVWSLKFMVREGKKSGAILFQHTTAPVPYIFRNIRSSYPLQPLWVTYIDRLIDFVRRVENFLFFASTRQKIWSISFVSFWLLRNNSKPLIKAKLRKLLNNFKETIDPVICGEWSLWQLTRR